MLPLGRILARRRKRTRRPTLPAKAERLYVGAMRLYAKAFRDVVWTEVVAHIPELAGVRKDGSPDQPRDEYGRWTEFGNGREAHVTKIRARVREYPRSSLPLESSTVPAAVEAERGEQLQRMKTELSTLEHKALDSFMGGRFQELRRAEIDGHPPDDAKTAKQLSRAIERFERRSKPIMCYRGLHVAPEIAEKLMQADSFDGLATSMWSTQPSLGAQFSAGMSTKDREKSVPIVLAGELKGMAADGDYGVEMLMRNKTLKITGREHYEHPKFGTICVLKVAEI